MGTQFEDFGSSNGGDFFHNSGIDPVDDNHSDDEQMLREGNDKVLREIEKRRKNREYARSETSRTAKTPDLNMSLVDWSGFPGAAHIATPPSAPSDKKPVSRKSSVHLNGSTITSSTDLERRSSILRSQRRLSAGGMGASSSISPSSPQRKEPNKKYRNRRHGAIDASLVLSKTGEKGTPDADKAKRRGSLTKGTTGGTNRTERRGLEGYGRGAGKRATSSSGTSSTSPSKSRSKSRTRRSQNSSDPSRSQSPVAEPPTASTSPRTMTRRPVSAAAASTTFEASSNKDPRRKGKQRSLSGGRRRSTQKAADELKKAQSFRW